MKKCYLSISLMIMMLFLGCFIQSATTQAKVKTFITKGNYIGTYGYKGHKPSLEGGGYTITINKISKNGKIRFQIHRAGRNASPLYDTKVIYAKIKGNKVKFRWEDSWSNHGTGIIIFKKGTKLKLTMKETRTAERNRSSLQIDNATFKYISKDRKVVDW